MLPLLRDLLVKCALQRECMVEEGCIFLCQINVLSAGVAVAETTLILLDKELEVCDHPGEVFPAVRHCLNFWPDHRQLRSLLAPFACTDTHTHTHLDLDLHHIPFHS